MYLVNETSEELVSVENLKCELLSSATWLGATPKAADLRLTRESSGNYEKRATSGLTS